MNCLIDVNVFFSRYAFLIYWILRNRGKEFKNIHENEINFNAFGEY